MNLFLLSFTLFPCLVNREDVHNEKPSSTGAETGKTDESRELSAQGNSLFFLYSYIFKLLYKLTNVV